jgi:hypothetical protein
VAFHSTVVLVHGGGGDRFFCSRFRDSESYMYDTASDTSTRYLVVFLIDHSTCSFETVFVYIF